MPEKKPSFPLGQVLITPAAQSSLALIDVVLALGRHRAGDWGDVCPEDAAENARSVLRGLRLLSVHRSQGVKFWIITEADRSSTTVLLPEEY